MSQANIAHGPQQVNNAVAAKGAEPAVRDPALRARKLENEQNKLLEQSNGEWVDTPAQDTPVSANPPLETVEAINGASNIRR